MRVCVVAPEISHQVANSGVGSHAVHLAQFFGRVAKVDVTVVVSTVSGDSLEQIRSDVWRECGARLISGDDLPVIAGQERLAPEQLRASHRIYRWLSGESFDAIFFMQYQCTGFSCIQAKRLGIAFQSTRLLLVLNGPRLWIEQFSKRALRRRISHLVIDYMEEYCAEHADTVLCASRALINWIQGEGWRLPKDTRLLRTWTPWTEASDVEKPDVSHWVFFGRLETRKGFEVFCDAVSRFTKDPPAVCHRLRIDLVGKLVDGPSGKRREALERWKSELPAWVEVRMHHSLSKTEVRDYLDSNRDAVFVFPSFADTFPNAVLECKVRGCAVLVATTAGCEEMIRDEGAFFQPTAPALEQKLRSMWTEGMPPSRVAFRMKDVEAERIALLREIEAEKAANVSCEVLGRKREKISVCVPFHNLGLYLDETLNALRCQTYPDFEVIVVDDGSEEPESIRAFDRTSAAYRDTGWRFLRTENRGVCLARNHAAAHARGEYLVFVDADNPANPEMLEVLEARLHHGGLDAITCYLYSFEDGMSSASSDLALHFGFPGGGLEAAFAYNTLGDTNMLIRRDVFHAVGGFQACEQEGSEDRALLIRLLRAGYSLDCTPEQVFSYRLRPNSLSRTGSPVMKRQAVLAAFCEGQEPWVRKLLEFHMELGTGNQQTGNEELPKWAEQKIAQLRLKYEIEREKRRERDMKADQRYAQLRKWRASAYVRFGRFLGIIDRDY